VSITDGFWLQYPAQKADDLVDLAGDLAATGYRPGVVFAPVGAPERLTRLYGRARGAGEAFLDPSGFLIDRDAGARRAQNFPWLDPSYGRPTDVATWAAWMSESLRHQLSNDFLGGADDPSIIVTPSPQLTAATGTAELYAVLDAAEAARDAVVAGPECWLGIVVDRDYLRLDARLTELADAVVTADYPGVVLRVFQTDLPPVADRRLLSGLRDLVEGCAGSGVKVFLPNSGWIGWLALAWGATGYSAGLSKGSWFDRIPTPMRNPGRREYIFEPQLLRHESWAIHQQLAADPAYRGCTCVSCQAMGGAFDSDHSAVHQIRIAHAWSDGLRPLNSIGRRRAIRDRIGRCRRVP